MCITQIQNLHTDESNNSKKKEKTKEIWEKIVDGFEEDSDFREMVLQNLDSDLDEIKNLENGESCTLTEYLSDYRYDLVFTKTTEGIFCNFDGQETYHIDLKYVD